MRDYKSIIAANIRYYASLREMRLGELANKAGITRQSLSTLLNKPADFRFGALINIANALEIEPSELLK